MANKLVNISAFVFFILGLSVPIQAQDKKNELFAQLRKRYGSMNSLEASFISMEPVSGIKGRLKALRSGKYVLDLNDRSIICDGHTIWNYHPSRKNVTINEVRSRPSTSLDIVLFNFLYNYQPKELKEMLIENVPHQGLELIPKSGKSAMGIRSLTIFVKRGSSEIKRIAAIDGNQTMVWELESMKINTSFSDALFTFIPPKNAEVIDLR